MIALYTPGVRGVMVLGVIVLGVDASVPSGVRGGDEGLFRGVRPLATPPDGGGLTIEEPALRFIGPEEAM